MDNGHGTTRSTSSKNTSRRVRFFFEAYSALAKLRWLTVGRRLWTTSSGMHAACLILSIDQRLPNARGWVQGNAHQIAELCD